MKNISSFHDCAVCGACGSICPTGAISVEKDKLFYTPSVNDQLCVKCGKCIAVCPVNQELPKTQMLDVYAAVHKDQNTVAASSSGGAFSALADHVLSQGGVVYGAAFSEDYKEVGFFSTDEASLDALRRSKYAESYVGDVFLRIREQLSKGRKVLFCGAPCQTAGLKLFLNQDVPNLLTCDFVCGGLPSHQLFKEYIDSLEGKYHSSVSQISFRPKSFGWREYAIKVTFQNGKTYLKPAHLDPYFSAFLYGKLSVKDYCMKCKFPSCHQSDIILADCWNYREMTGKKDNDTGVSMVIANTEKGRNILKKLNPVIRLSPLRTDQAVYIILNQEPSESQLEKRRQYLEACDQIGVVGAGRRHCVAKGLHALKIKMRTLKKKQTISNR